MRSKTTKAHQEGISSISRLAKLSLNALRRHSGMAKKLSRKDGQNWPDAAAPGRSANVGAILATPGRVCQLEALGALCGERVDPR